MTQTTAIEFSDFLRELWKIKYAKDRTTVPDLIDALRSRHPELIEHVGESGDARSYLQAYLKAHPLDEALLQDYRYEVDRLMENDVTLDPLDELNRMIGLRAIKQEIQHIRDFVSFHLLRKKRGLSSYMPALHMAFKGDPGTGKTTVARILGRLLKEIGFLPKGHVIEVSRGELVGEFIGQTAPKVMEVVERATGGILFIDEAYLLTRAEDPKDYGHEALGTLVKLMEDRRDRFVLIMAGYSNEMDTFIKTNPGLDSRIPFKLDFPNYTSTELMEIAVLLARQQDFHIDQPARELLESALGALNETQGGNGRLVRNIVEKSILRKASHVMSKPEEEISNDELTLLTSEDLALPAELVDQAPGE